MYFYQVEGAIEASALNSSIYLLSQPDANFSDAVCLEPSDLLSKHRLKIMESNTICLAMGSRQPKHHLTVSDEQDAHADN